jgi:hypothetical protein
MCNHGKANFGISMAMVALVLVLRTVLALPEGAFAQERGHDGGHSSADNEQDLINQVVANELSAQKQDHSLWRYKQRKTEGGQTRLCEIVETDRGSLYRVIAINGRPLSSDAVRTEDARVRELAANPEELQKEEQRVEHDVQMERRLLKMIPEAFVSRYAGQDDRLTKLHFAPNSSFRPSSRESQIFHHLDGTIWVDARRKRIARIEGRLISEVKFGDGILGHLEPGGTLSIEQRDVGGNHWELTNLNVNMNGKALFFKTVNVHQKESDFDFRPVSPGISVEKAAQLIKQGVEQRAARAPGPVGED